MAENPRAIPSLLRDWNAKLSQKGPEDYGGIGDSVFLYPYPLAETQEDTFQNPTFFLELLVAKLPSSSEQNASFASCTTCDLLSARNSVCEGP